MVFWSDYNVVYWLFFSFYVYFLYWEGTYKYILLLIILVLSFKIYSLKLLELIANTEFNVP